MKRALLIAGGTVGGLGAVLAITPPQITSTQDISGLAGSLGGGTQATQSNPVAASTTSAPEPAATTSTASPSKAAATKNAQVISRPNAATQRATPAPTPTKSAATTPTPTATKTTAAPSSGGYSGSVTGASFNARNYGTLSATVTFSNGKITNVSASQSPVSWAQRALTALIPYVNAGSITVEQIKQYSVTQLPCSTGNSCRSQASFTAEAFWSSVKSAISKAGL